MEIKKSTRRTKKYMIKYNDKLIHFGAIKKDGTGYEQYKDTTGLGLYSHLDHNDAKRRLNYRKRHSKILLKNGEPAYKDKNQPAYYSWRFLW